MANVEKKEEFVSLAELELLEEQELAGFNPEADANAGLPPLPAGDYIARVYYTSADPDKIWAPKMSRKNKPYYGASVTLETVSNKDPMTDGRKFTHNAMTLVTQGGTTSCQALLQALGFGEQLMRSPKTAKAQIKLLNDALSGDAALVGVALEWEARFSVEKKDGSGDYEELKRVRGMKKFDKDANGDPIPFVDYKGEYEGVQYDEQVPARNYVKNFIPLSDLQGAATSAAPSGQAPGNGEPASNQPAPARAAARPAAAAPTPAPRPAPRPAAAPTKR